MKKVNRLEDFPDFDKVKEVLGKRYIGKTKIPRKLLKEQKYDTYIKKREIEYIRFASCKELFRLGPSSQLLEIEQKKLKKFYEANTLQLRNILPTLNSNIAQIPICPFCERQISGGMTTEHVLPKSDAAEFMLTPANMIVACRDCNSFNHSNMGKTATDTEINLYFEEYDISENINIIIENNSEMPKGYSPKVSFIRVENSDTVCQERLEKFWDNYGLGNTYTLEAIKQFEEMSTQIICRFKDNKVEQLSSTSLFELLDKIKRDSHKAYCINKRFTDCYWQFRIASYYIDNKEELENLTSFLSGLITK